MTSLELDLLSLEGWKTIARDVDLLSLDAGNTVVYFDHARLSRVFVDQGFAVGTDALNRAEGEAKIAQELGTMLAPDWSGADQASLRTWGAFMATLIHRAGVGAADVPRVLEAAWSEHRRRSLWCRVPDGLVPALAQARAASIRVAIVSNSEGQLEPFLAEVGLLSVVDLVVDSGRVGVEKPDPRIFRVALDRFGVPPSRALHLGDIYATDMVGARAAGMHAALIDPFGHLAGRHPDVPRVAGAAEVARALASVRAKGAA